MSHDAHIEAHIDSKVLDWFVCGETGASSMAMAAYLTGRAPRYGEHSYPGDGDDFGRCLKLLEAVPELRERLPRMAGASPYWAALIAHWDELERCFHEERPMYMKIQEILAPVVLEQDCHQRSAS